MEQMMVIIFDRDVSLMEQFLKVFSIAEYITHNVGVYV